LSLVSNARPDDVLLVLLSGGASALVACPAHGLTLEDLAETTRVLLASGADIGSQNCVRKHLSGIAGGRLAVAAGCDRIEVLAVSDVADDALDVIGSGPCHGDPTRYSDAVEVLRKYRLMGRVPAAVVRHLERGVRGELSETPKPGDPKLAKVSSRVIARNGDARAAIVAAARRDGTLALDLGEVLVGEARTLGRRLAALARSTCLREPLLLVAGGESVVTVRGDGRGGRSQELALAAALHLDGADSNGRLPDVCLLAAGTDGTDGPTDAAGACVDSGTIARGRSLGLDAQNALAANDAHSFFAGEGGLVETGPTGTNVMDLVLIGIGPDERN
jgi:glycerate-2-kinase